MSTPPWVNCPGCNGRVYFDTLDQRSKKWKLRCPYCDVEVVADDARRSPQ
ncbi:MAG TPA: hypothetical protein VGE94_06035 [Chloroflexota bacterium]|jgi:DNA-directed RNA polymerase subunit RPC12/RpoP